MKFDLEEKLHKKIDLVSSQAVSKHILPFINKDKQLIYENKMGDKQRLLHILDAISEIDLAGNNRRYS